MRVRTDLTRYFAIRRRNFREDWQEGFNEIKKADCLKRRRVRKREREERGGGVLTAAHGGRRETG